MKNKLAILALGAVLSSGLFVANASAVTVLPGSTSTLNSVSDPDPDLAGFYIATVTTISSKLLTSVTKTFSFVAAAGFPTVDVVVSASGSGDTSATWKDQSTSIVSPVSNIGIVTFALIVGHTYDLVFKVTHFASKKASVASSSFTVTPSPVPVPPAAILLLSGLVGIGALGRKRSGKVSV